MNYKYRLKTYKDEEGEYSEYQPADKELIVKIIETHWTNDSRPNGLEIISISNDSGQHLLLEHFKNNVFDVYFLPTTTEIHFHKKSTIGIVLNSIDSFFGNNIIELENSLNRTKKENKYIRGDFFFVDHNYRFTKERSFKEGLWMAWMGIPIGIMLLSIGVMALLNPHPLVTFLGFFFLAAGLYFWLPGLFLHLQYKKDISDWIIRVTKSQDKIIAKSPTTTKELNKIDIVKIIKHENLNSRIPWADYGYTQLEFKSGDIINLTNLMVDQLFILDKFQDDTIKKYKVKEWIPSIQLKTKIE